MKNLKVFISVIVLTLFVGSTAFASTPTKTSSKNQLRTELVKLLGDLDEFDQETNITAYVSFIVNDENEIVVISIDSKNKQVDAVLKGKLNYKKVVASGIKRGEVYIMPLKIVKNS